MATSEHRPQQGRPPGRQAEAAANDGEIAAAAFDILTVHPQASMADIADQAGVGVASLYRRYPTRQALVHHLCVNAMTAITTTAENAAARLRDPDVDPWAEFTAFLAAALAAGAGAMRSLAGTFHADAALASTAAEMNHRMQEVVSLAQGLGAVRVDVTAADITQLFEMLRVVHVGDRVHSEELRQRYLALFATALRPGSDADGLPFPAPSWREISTSWNQRRPAPRRYADRGTGRS